jgi:hypothetical protein
MRLGCIIGVSRQGARDSGLHVAVGLTRSRGREEQSVVLALMVAFLVMMFQVFGQCAT